MISTPDFATQLAAMIGLGVGIDYALFLITRFRQNYRSGMDLQTSISEAMDTAGRAVLFAGITVIIALLGQFLLGVGFLTPACRPSLAVPLVLAVLMTVLAALSRAAGSASHDPERIALSAGTAAVAKNGECAGPREARGAWSRWASLIQRHPWPGAVAGLAIMLTLAAPALALRLGNSDAGNNPPSLTCRPPTTYLPRASDAASTGLCRWSRPYPTRATPPRWPISANRCAPPGTSRPSRPPAEPEWPDGRFRLTRGRRPSRWRRPTSSKACASRRCRRWRGTPGARILVGGQQATTIDFTSVLSSKLPLFIGIVVALSALLLLIVFRSLVIPVQAAFMNLLSIGAALGVVVAIFQWGWLGSFFNVKGGPSRRSFP